MAVETGILGALQILGKRVAAQSHEKDFRERAVGAKGTRHLVAIHAGQSDIAKDHLGPELARLRQPLGTAVGDRDLVLAELENLAKATGGCQRLNLGDVWRDIPKKLRLISLTPYLLLAAVVIFLLEVVQRRTGLLSVGWKPLDSLRRKVVAKLPSSMWTKIP